MNPKEKVEAMLKEDGAVLVRNKNHNVYRLSNGQNFAIAKTPSDHRAELNQLRDLRKALGMKVEFKEGIRRERKVKKSASISKFNGFNLPTNETSALSDMRKSLQTFKENMAVEIAKPPERKSLWVRAWQWMKSSFLFGREGRRPRQ